MFDEYKQVKRFKNVKEIIPKIVEAVDAEPDTALQQEVYEKHSFENFKRQLGRIVQEVFTNE